MKVRKYIQTIQVGELTDLNWKTITAFKDAETVNKYLEEAEKNDTRYFFGTYFSPRLGQFRIKYLFVEESEE